MTENSSTEVRYFTGEDFTLTRTDREAIESALTFVQSGDYAEETVRDTVKGAGARNRRSKRDAAVARVVMAGAVHAALTADLVGKGKAYDTKADLGLALGVSGGSVTGLASLGLALSKGYGPHFGTWSVASSKAGRKEFRNVVESASDGSAIDGAVARLFTPDGKDATPRKAASERDAPESTDATPAVEVSPMEAIGAALAVIAAQARNLSVEDWSLVEDRIQTIVTKEVTIRAAAAKKAAKAA